MRERVEVTTEQQEDKWQMWGQLLSRTHKIEAKWHVAPPLTLYSDMSARRTGSKHPVRHPQLPDGRTGAILACSKWELRWICYIAIRLGDDVEISAFGHRLPAISLRIAHHLSVCFLQYSLVLSWSLTCNLLLACAKEGGERPCAVAWCRLLYSSHMYRFCRPH